jgi:hypothetical protein
MEGRFGRRFSRACRHGMWELGIPISRGFTPRALGRPALAGLASKEILVSLVYPYPAYRLPPYRLTALPVPLTALIAPALVQIDRHRISRWSAILTHSIP